MRCVLVFCLLMLLITAGCNPASELPSNAQPSPQVTDTIAPSHTPLPTNTPTSTDTPLPTSTPTLTFTSPPTDTPTTTQTASPSPSPTPSDTPTPSNTATPTSTPTEATLTVTALMNANCRWGPGTAYRGSGVIFYEGDIAVVEGRNHNLEGAWYWIQMDDIGWHCWVHSSTITLNGDPGSLPFVAAQVPQNDAVAPPTNVQATRQGDTVTITWDPAQPALELGYLIQARVCQGGFLMDGAFATEATAYTIRDEDACSGDSNGTLYVSNKLGYSNPVPIPWP